MVWRGARVRELRLERKLSQEQVGERSDLHRNEIGVIERGETNISFVNLLRIRRALNSRWGRQRPPPRE
jgi:transcriptional regulator with XRE-family HTH domain